VWFDPGLTKHATRAYISLALAFKTCCYPSRPTIRASFGRSCAHRARSATLTFLAPVVAHSNHSNALGATKVSIVDYTPHGGAAHRWPNCRCDGIWGKARVLQGTCLKLRGMLRGMVSLMRCALQWGCQVGRAWELLEGLDAGQTQVDCGGQYLPISRTCRWLLIMLRNVHTRWRRH
jgi:hypothetical protein